MRAAVLGSPIAHSLSPALHRAAYASLGLDDWQYDAIEIDADGLAGFLEGLDATWAGLSLTMPLKEAAVPLVHSIDDEAAVVRAVNTLVRCEGGWHGANTDVRGIVAALEGAGAGLVAGTGGGRLTTATVIGAGATARSALAAIARFGVREVSIHARRPEAGADAARVASALGLRARVHSFDPDLEAMQASIVVCTVPGEAGAPWAQVASAAQGVLLDVAYAPWPTAVAAAWAGSGLASGRDLLLWQAVEQVRLMTGREAPVAAMRAALPAA